MVKPQDDRLGYIYLIECGLKPHIAAGILEIAIEYWKANHGKWDENT